MTNEKPSITPLDGKTTVDDKVRFEPERLSYQSASLIAERIARRVSKELEGWSVVIVDTSTVADIANLEATFFELTQLANDYEALAERAVQLHERRSERSEDSVKTKLPPGSGVIQESFVVAPVITAATTAISAGLGLMSLFRQDVELHGTETSIDSLSFKIALAEQLCSKTKVLIAELYVPHKEDLSKSKLQQQMAQVRAAYRA